MSRVIRLSLIFSLALVAWGLTAGAQPFPKDIQRIVEQRKLRVAMLAYDYPPVIMTGPDGRLQGLDVELARDLAQELGVEVEFVRTADTFDGLVQLVAEKKADLALSLLSVTPARAQRVYFSNPYLNLHLALLVNRRQWLLERKKSPQQDIKQTTASLGVLRGSTFLRRAQKDFPHSRLKVCDTFEEGVAAVQKGETLAVLDEDIVLQNYLKKEPGAALTLTIQVLKDMPDFIAIAVRPDSPHLLAWVNVYLLTKEVPAHRAALMQPSNMKPRPEDDSHNLPLSKSTP